MGSADGNDRTRAPRRTKEPDSAQRSSTPDIPFPDPPPLLPDNVVKEQHIDFNSIVGRHLNALTIEVGKFIQSTGFEAGVGGWNIDGEGNAEFNSVTIRGAFRTAESGARVQIDERGVPLIGWLPGVRLHNGHDLEIGPDARPGRLWMDHTGVDDFDTAARPSVTISSGQWDGHAGGAAEIVLYGEDGDFVIGHEIRLKAVNTHIAGNLTINEDDFGSFIYLVGTHADSALKGDWGGSGAAITCRGGQLLTVEWTGTQLKFYVDDVLRKTI